MDTIFTASRKPISALICISKAFTTLEVLESRHTFLGGNGLRRASWEKVGGSSKGEGVKREAAESLLVAQ